MAGQTVEVPESAVERSQYDVSGAGYEPGAKLFVELKHDSGWRRTRDVGADADGRFQFVSNAHLPGSIEVVVKQSNRDDAITYATTSLVVTPAPDDDGAAGADE